MTAVICAFPATGKTFLARRDHRLLDSDSSSFSWAEPYVRHTDWPHNYIEHIQTTDADVVLCSTHEEVREALQTAGIRFALVYPREDLRGEYIARLRRRGSPDAMVDLVATMWDQFIASCRAQQGCTHVVLGAGEYLADRLQTAIRSADHETSPFDEKDAPEVAS